MRLMPALLVLYGWCYVSGDSDGSTEEESGYAFYYPLVMESKQPAKVCLEVDEHVLPGKVQISFGNETCESRAINTGFSCWDIVVPENISSTSKINIDITTKDNVKITGEEEVQVIRNEPKVFIETDRKFYKKGDTVKIRFLALNHDLKPMKDYRISSLHIRSPPPSNAVIKQWENISTDSGLAQVQFQLAPDTLEGYWSIMGSGVNARFEVRRYILPRFQTFIEGSFEIYETVKSITYSVCGQYSHGGNVKGTALVVIKATFWSGTTRNHSQVKDLDGGCAKFEFFGDDLSIKTVWVLQITGTVTEEGTGQVESENKVIYIDRSAFSHDWMDSDLYYIKTELPHKAKLSFDIKVPLNPPEVCYGGEFGEFIVCSNFTLDSDNNLEFTVPPIKNITGFNYIHIRVHLGNSTGYYPSLYLKIWHSDSRNAIKISKSVSNPKKCGSSLSFSVLYNSGRFKNGENVEFKYILSSRNEIVSTGSVLHKPKQQNLDLEEYPNVIGKEEYEFKKNPIDKFDFNIELDSKVYTDSKLLVYYEYDKEVISDYIDISVTKCNPNEVEAKWVESPLYPGEVGQLNIKTDSESLCSVSSVDKASKFLGSGERITTESILKGFSRESNVHKLNCIKPENNLTAHNIHSKYSSSLFDSYDAFKELNVGIISNMKFISKTCKVSTPLWPSADVDDVPGAIDPALAVISGGIDAGVSDDGVAVVAAIGTSELGGSAAVSVSHSSPVRSFFPETWLWDLVPVADGEVTIERVLPDSITDWVGNVLCVSSNKGVGLSDNMEMKAFKPFFLDILLPYSIKRNKEILRLPILVFNYLNHSLPIRVTLEPSDDIVLVDGEQTKHFSMCLASADSYTHHYRIKSTKIGYASITVSADVDPSYVENCTPESVIGQRDIVKKSVLVEPEGYPSGLSKGAVLCANDPSGPDNIDWQINLPENVVLDTLNGKVLLNSDLLGPMIQNLESILVIPTGCGEQIMATLTPNLYVLKYLEANNALTDSTKEKILKNLEIGYQRMLNYVNNDGSFSAFGNTDGEGSMFLTAFVIRTFKHMKKYIVIDDDVINKGVKWIINHQLENGCFDQVYHVFHEMDQANAKNQTTALTSYVLISVLETNITIEQNVISRAKECILNDNTSDKYTLAISSYALGLMNLTEDVQKRLDKLIELADNTNGLTWWSQSETSLSVNVEISSYVLLSLLQQNPTENLGIANSVFRYLQSQINARGGFFSTQDTVIGLDAISRYALLVYKNEPNVNVSVVTNDNSKEFEITKRDRTKTEEIPLTSYPNKIKAKISGSGCILVQAAVDYYLDKPLVTEDLKLDITLKPVSQNLKCSVIEVKPCVSYTSPGSINMAIVEVTLLSGYAADQTSLYELTSSSSTDVKKFEQIKDQVVFYLTQLSSNEVCLPFKIQENLIIENVANATVKLYDYYKPELSASKSFTLDDCMDNIAIEA